MYQLVPFDIQHKEQLRRLISEVLPERPKEYFDEKWWWTFSSPPLTVAIEQSTQQVVGVCAYVPFAAYSHGSEFSSAWFVDFFVLKEHQGKGLGKLLTKTVMGSFQITSSLSQTDQAWFTFRKIGWNQRSVAKLFINPWAYFPSLLARLSKKDFLKSGVDVQKIDFEDVTVLHRDMIDQIWSNGRDRFDIVSSRTSDSLTKRFATRRNHRYKLYIACSEEGPVGYMVARTLPPNSINSLKRYSIGKKPVGLIVDYFICQSRLPVFRTLLSLALDDLIRSGASTLLCLCQGEAEQRDLKQSGFLHAGTPLIGRFLKRMDVGFTYYANSNLQLPQNPTWFLTLADCDMDRSWGESEV
jgi:hypothetical protein